MYSIISGFISTPASFADWKINPVMVRSAIHVSGAPSGFSVLIADSLLEHAVTNTVINTKNVAKIFLKDDFILLFPPIFTIMKFRIFCW